MTDDKSTSSLDELISNIEVPPIDDNAKKIAMNLAMAEFNQQHQNDDIKNNQNKTQGFWSWLRPISNILTTNRKNIMAIINNKLIYSGVATLSVAVMGTLLFQQTYRPPFDPSTSIVGEEILASPSGQLLVKQKGVRERKEDIQEKKVERQDNSGQSVVASSQSHQPQELERTEALGTSSSGVSSSHSTLADKSIRIASKPSGDQVINPQALPMIKKEIAIAEYKRAFSTAQAPIAGGKSISVPDIIAPQPHQEQGRDNFESVEASSIKLVSEEPVSTFSVDVDTASYSFARRQLNQGVLPQKDAVRIEEMVNYFDYDYPLAESTEQPFKPSISVQASPWNNGKKLVHIGVKGYDIPHEQQPRSNLVLLLDVSGSMNSQDKLPLVKQSMSLLLDTLHPEDTIAIAVYAGAAGQVLAPTPAKDKQTILNALNRLNAGGSTAGGQGIKLAYQLAEANFNKEAVNRIILATDGDFNVGIRNSEELKGFVERKREQGIFLSVLGFGQGNYNDQLMQALAQNGNGIAAYIDSVREAQKVLIDEATSTLFPIAKDVKIQVEFNPKTVSEYRLIGYETRHLNREDFTNDKVDAGDIGAGHTVTAIYEITPKEAGSKTSIEPLRYEDSSKSSKEEKANSDLLDNEYGFLKIRYKLPTEDTSRLISQAITSDALLSDKLTGEAEFATAVAGFAQLLKGGKYLDNYTYDNVISAAQNSKGDDTFGYRTEFIQLVRSAKVANVIK